MNHLENLKNKLDNKSAIIGIVGLGYVGLPLLLRYVEAGYRVLGLDIDALKAKKLNGGQTYIKHIPSDVIANSRHAFEATTDFRRAKEADALILCLPTPLNAHREPDLSFVINTVDTLTPYLRPGQIVSLESTTYPGTTDEELWPRIQSTGLCVGEHIALVYSPEREDPGNPNFSTRTIPKVLGGLSPSCLEVGVSLYSQVIDKLVTVSSTRAAEMTKLLENIHRAVNIGLVNEIKIIADRMGIDVHEVINAAATKPFGFVPYFPGPGLGGHCIPIDPFYLTWKAREYGVNTRFIELAGEINSTMPQWVVTKVTEALNDREKSVKGSKILILGIAYKKNIDDMRESPAVIIMELLKEKGALLAYSDPHVPLFPKMREHSFNFRSKKIDEKNIKKYDCVLIATDHDEFDYNMIKNNAKMIIDTRGVYRKREINIIQA
jgi:UDP-N-acetyl-D-glucosamine dehydrogenase